MILLYKTKILLNQNMSIQGVYCFKDFKTALIICFIALIPDKCFSRWKPNLCNSDLVPKCLQFKQHRQQNNKLFNFMSNTQNS